MIAAIDIARLRHYFTLIDLMPPVSLRLFFSSLRHVIDAFDYFAAAISLHFDYDFATPLLFAFVIFAIFATLSLLFRHILRYAALLLLPLIRHMYAVFSCCRYVRLLTLILLLPRH